MAKLHVFLVVAAVVLGTVSALTDEERNSMREAAMEHVESCAKEFKITKENMLEAKKTGKFDALDSCFYACFLKKIGSLDDKGLFDPDAFLAKSKKHIKDADDLAKIAEIGKICSSVNDQTVSDGDKGCERAMLLLPCIIKEKNNYLTFQSA